MFGPEWEQGCKSCAFWADSFDHMAPHLAARDVAFAAVSRAPPSKLSAFRARMGWGFPWVSSLGSDFNYDFGVSFRADERQAGAVTYNYRKGSLPREEAPGISVFARNQAGAVFHTNSTFGHGLDLMNAACDYLDLVPKGRDKQGLDWTMQWVRLRNEYKS